MNSAACQCIFCACTLILTLRCGRFVVFMDWQMYILDWTTIHGNINGISAAEIRENPHDECTHMNEIRIKNEVTRVSEPVPSEQNQTCLTSYRTLGF
jgi:hypothetical protein